MENLIYRAVSQDIQFEDENLQIKLIDFEQSILKQHKDYLSFWVALVEFKRTYTPSNNLYLLKKTKQGKCYYFTEFLLQHFNIEIKYYDKVWKVISRFTNYRESCNCLVFPYNNVVLNSCFFGFSPSKLFELLSLTDSELKNAFDKKELNPKMTVKEIREYIRLIKGKTKTKFETEEEDKKFDIDLHNKNVVSVNNRVSSVLDDWLKDIDKDYLKKLKLVIQCEINKLLF